MLFSLAVLCFFSHGVRVEIINSTGNTLHNFRLLYQGGQVQENLVNPQQAFRYKIDPSSETDLTMEFIDRDGTVRKMRIEVYIEPNYGGKIKIIVRDNYDLDVYDCSAPYICLSGRLLWFLGINCNKAQYVNQ